MCGIVGYIGHRKALGILLDGLKLSEYRGYDSAGVAIMSAEILSLDIFAAKEFGKVSNLVDAIKDDLDGRVGIGHTRWATHGVPSTENAHPHFDCRHNIYLVHNGIVENYRSLKKDLETRGHRFVSQTDTEVVAHLIEEYYEGDIEAAFRRAIRELEGSYGIVMISKFDPDKLFVAKKNQPILIGAGDGENIVASDASAIIQYTKRVNFLGDGEIAVVGKDDYVIYGEAGEVIANKVVELALTPEQLKKGDFDHFMLKEIHEQPDSLRRALSGRLNKEEGLVVFDDFKISSEQLLNIDDIVLVACGTAFYAALCGEYLFEELVGVRARALIASEFRYRPISLTPRTLVIVVSQSGETADTLFAVKKAKEHGCLIIGVVNVLGSTIAREVQAVIYNLSGPEVSVASTKAFTSQITILTLLAVYLGRQRNLSVFEAKNIFSELEQIPEKVASILQQESRIKTLAEKYHFAQSFAFLGRGYSYPVALEGALKLKEISYIHAEGWAAGEMKHGSIALIDEYFPVLGIVPHDAVYEKTCSNLAEVKARLARIIAVATEGDREIQQLADDIIFVPTTLPILSPLLTVIPLQLLSYYTAVGRGRNVDQPRNLAKSVTVE